MNNEKEAFIQIYDEFRDCEYNKEYYARRADSYRNKLKRLDIFLALFATGSAVAGFALWDVKFGEFAIGQIALGTLGGLAVVLGIAKPYLKWEDRLEELSGMYGTYAALSHAHKDNVLEVKDKRDVSSDNHLIYSILRDLRGMLTSKEDSSPLEAVKNECASIVNKRYPTSFFYYPKNKS